MIGATETFPIILFTFLGILFIVSLIIKLISDDASNFSYSMVLSPIVTSIFISIWAAWIQNDSTNLFILTQDTKFENDTLLVCDVSRKNECVSLGGGVYFTFARTLVETDDWVYEAGEREPFDETIKVILEKFEDIEDRLSTAYENKADLQEKYGKDFPVENIDADIKHLNNLGWQLVEPTKRFFEIAKQHMMKVDEANARAEAMQGLKTFTEQIEVAGNQPSEALEQSVADITAAIDNLEKAMNQ